MGARERGSEGEPRPPNPSRFAVLLGDPVAHSLSPRIHNAAFRALGIDAVYLACRVEADRLGEAVAGLRALGALGANVTVPHKEAVLAHVDRLTPAAAAIGAVNTLVFDGDAVVGDNTDAEGFAHPLAAHADLLSGADVTVLGAGGAARAVVYALLTRFGVGAVTVAARRPEQAGRLAADLDEGSGRLRAGALAQAGAAVRSSALVVNTTPVGMAPDVDATPWSEAADFHADQLVYDLVYAPRETRLLREAAASGATPIGGLAMLVGQASAAFARWTGRAMPLEAVYRALDARASQ